MLRKIENREIISKKEAKKKYAPYHILMITTEAVDRIYEDLGYVIYIADKEWELHDVPREEYEGLSAAFMVGMSADPYPMVGNVVYHG